MANDNKDCIQVKGEVGLTNLWQRHLTKLPSITLESAEAIIANYPMPSKLIQVSATSAKSGVDGELSDFDFSFVLLLFSSRHTNRVIQMDHCYYQRFRYDVRPVC